MQHCVYLLISNHKNKVFTYVGYTKNLQNRLHLHNISRGAKYTRGKKWIVFYKEIFKNKSKAMSREYKLKRDRKFRNFLKEKFMKKKQQSIILTKVIL